MTHPFSQTTSNRVAPSAGSRWRNPQGIKRAADGHGAEDGKYIPINSSLLTYGGNVHFDVHMKKSGQYFLFAKGGRVGGKSWDRLIENGSQVLYISNEDREAYNTHAGAIFSTILQDNMVPLKERSNILHSYSLDVCREVLSLDGILNLSEEHSKKIEKLVEGTYEYLSRNKGALSGIGKLMQHNNKTYNHCVNVSLYSLSMLVHLGYDRATCKFVGAGANLHDVGKLKVPREILEKPGRLTDEERRVINNHPSDGLRLCRNMGLDTIACDCVIFHHEKIDGSGYPVGAHGIPEHVRIVTVADIFDALTAERPYSKRRSSFEALKTIMKDVEAGKLDRRICREFVKILSSNGLMA